MSDPTVTTPASLMERLRARRNEIAERQTVDIRIPGYGGELVARYRLIDTPQADEIGARVRNEFKKESERLLYASIDLLAVACEGIQVKTDGGELVPLDPDGDGVYIYDSRLAGFLGFETENARQTILGVFAGNEFAVVNHSQRLQRWMNDTSVDVDEEFLGEA